MTVMTTGQAIAESLIAHGVDTVFGIPGAHMYDFNDALAQRQRRAALHHHASRARRGIHGLRLRQIHRPDRGLHRRSRDRDF